MRLLLVRGALFGALVLGTSIVRPMPALAGADVCPEPNDTPDKACPISAGATVIGYLNSADDVDRYKLQVGQGQIVQASLSTLPGDYTLRIEASDGSTLTETGGSGGTDDRSVGATGLAAGTYYVAVLSLGGDSSADQPYGLKVSVQGPTAGSPPASDSPGTGGPLASAPDRPISQLVLRDGDMDKSAKQYPGTSGSDGRASWYEITYKRDKDQQRTGPMLIINRVYRAADAGTAHQIFQEQGSISLGLPEAKAQKPPLFFGSLGSQPLDPVGEEASAVGGCQPCSGEPAQVFRHYRIVFRMGNLVETIYTYGTDSGSYFGVAFDLAKIVEKRINTPPEDPLKEVITSHQPGEIGLHIEDAGKEATEMFAKYGSDDRSSWYESRYERGDEFLGKLVGPGIIYNKVWVAKSIDLAKAIFQENSVLDLPESTRVHVGIFVEPKIRKFAADSYAVGSCNVDCNSQIMDRLHERLTFRRGNVVVVLYIWGDKDESGPTAELVYANIIYNRIP